VQPETQNPYRRAATWAAVIVAVIWMFFFLPVKLFPHAGDTPRNLIISIAHVFLLPGEIVSIFLYYPASGTSAALAIWQLIVVTLNWVFYFGAIALVMILRQKSREAATSAR
jgi:hypothetical protein